MTVTRTEETVNVNGVARVRVHPVDQAVSLLSDALALLRAGADDRVAVDVALVAAVEAAVGLGRARDAGAGERCVLTRDAHASARAAASAAWSAAVDAGNG